MTAAVARRARPRRVGTRRLVDRRVAALALVAVAGAGAAVVALGEDGPTSSPVGSGIPITYAIDYEVVLADGPTTTERVVVARPFRSAVIAEASGRVSDVGVLATRGGDGSWVDLEVPIALGSADLRPDVVLAAAVADGHVVRGGERTIAGRTCTVHRFGGPIASGTLTPLVEADAEHADACIDAQGLVLEEVWSIDGEVVRTRTATAVDLDPDLGEVLDLPDGARTLAPEDGGGATQPVPADHDPGFLERWGLEDVPPGFERAGTWVVVPPSARPADEPGPRRAEVALLTQAWVRGADLVLLDQGATVAGIAPPFSDAAVVDDIVIPGLGAAQLAWDLRTSEIRILRPEGGFVRLAGTLAPDDLVGLARSLVLAGGTP